jgi:hypothetical protein
MNKETAHLYLPLVQALADGKTIEFQTTGDDEKWVEMINVSFGPSPHKYRIKPKPEPKPAMVPLGPEDVPPGSVIRHVGSEYWSLVIYANRKIVKLHDRWIKYEPLYPTYEIKRPGEDWKPCHKPA